MNDNDERRAATDTTDAVGTAGAAAGSAVGQSPEALLAAFRDTMGHIRSEIARVIVGQDAVIEQLLITVLVGGHCLITGLPGTAKTLMVRALGQTLGLSARRIQFTPDLMPTDVTGTDIIEEDVTTGHRRWTFVPGPVFANLLLADEINRTPPKTQAALLEAMQEASVTVRGTTYPLPPPFVVLATQNPIELEGTYPLPEAQLDRFLQNVVLDYLDAEQEVAVVARNVAGMPIEDLDTCTDAASIISYQALVRQVPIADHLTRWAVELVRATRPESADAPDAVRRYLQYGASVRAAIYLTLGARARALLRGRYHVVADDLKALARPILRHRLQRNYLAESDGVGVDTLIDELVQQMKVRD